MARKAHAHDHDLHIKSARALDKTAGARTNLPVQATSAHAHTLYALCSSLGAHNFRGRDDALRRSE